MNEALLLHEKKDHSRNRSYRHYRNEYGCYRLASTETMHGHDCKGLDGNPVKTQNGVEYSAYARDQCQEFAKEVR